MLVCRTTQKHKKYYSILWKNTTQNYDNTYLNFEKYYLSKKKYYYNFWNSTTKKLWKILLEYEKKILLWTMENTTLACNWFAMRGSTMIMFYALEITTTVSFELLLFLILPQPT